MKNIITIAALILLPLTALVGGHTEFGWHGTGITVHSKVIAG